MIGRAFLYGLGAMGEAGVTRALEIIHKELDLTMAFCGHTDIRGVDRRVLLPGHLLRTSRARTAMKLAEFEALKAWHQRHWRDQPVEKHAWDIVLTLWLVGWVGFPSACLVHAALGRGDLHRPAVPARQLRRAAPSPAHGRRAALRLERGARAPQPALEVAALERVAAVDAARLDAALEPVDALRAGAVREGLGHDRALRLALQRVVADLRGGVERRLDVARLEAPALLLLRTGRPDAGEAVGLQLDAARSARWLAPRRRGRAARRPCP